jgi:glycosyltransferase involved in cell wall biosynthesis
MRAMKDRGFDVVACGPADDFRPKLEKEGIRFVHVGTNMHSVNPITELRVIARLWSVYRAEQPVMVHHFALKPSIYGSLAARFAGVPVIINTVTGLGYALMSGGLLSRVVAALWRVSCKHSTWTTFQNPDNANLFREAGMVDPQKLAIILGSGVNCSLFSPESGGSSLATPRKQVTFLMFGRILRDKGVLEYLEAAASVLRSSGADPTKRRARFVLLGGARPGNPTSVGGDWLTNPASIPAEIIAQYVNNGIVEHHPNSDDVARFIHASDVVVLPSYGEGVPRTLLEGMACGKPVITTDVPGCREVVEHLVNGLLVKPRCATALAEAFEYILSHVDELGRMGEASRRLAVDKFSDAIVIEKNLDNYRRAGLAV